MIDIFYHIFDIYAINALSFDLLRASMNKRMTGRGFTLIEVVLVLVLLGILGAVAIPKYYDLEAKAQRDAARAYANQFCADVNGRIAQLLFEGKSCVDAQKEALIELNKKYFYDESTPGVDKSNPNGMRILPPPETGYKNPTEITVLLKSGETWIFQNPVQTPPEPWFRRANFF